MEEDGEDEIMKEYIEREKQSKKRIAKMYEQKYPRFYMRNS